MCWINYYLNNRTEELVSLPNLLLFLDAAPVALHFLLKNPNIRKELLKFIFNKFPNHFSLKNNNFSVKSSNGVFRVLFLCSMKVIIHNKCFRDVKTAACKLHISWAKHEPRYPAIVRYQFS